MDGVCGICGKSHISGTVSVVPRHIELMFEAGIDSISRGGNLGGMRRRLNPL